MNPDGTSNQIRQRRLYVTLIASYDNNSPPQSLPIYFVCYGVKSSLQNDLDMTIFDSNESYDIINETMQMHIPIDIVVASQEKKTHNQCRNTTILLTRWRTLSGT